MTTELKTRLYNAVMAAPQERRGYVLQIVTGDVSFQDFLTDLAPFIEAEIQQARREAFTEAAAMVYTWHLQDSETEAALRSLPGGGPPSVVADAVAKVGDRIRARGQ